MVLDLLPDCLCFFLRQVLAVTNQYVLQAGDLTHSCVGLSLKLCQIIVTRDENGELLIDFSKPLIDPIHLSIDESKLHLSRRGGLALTDLPICLRDRVGVGNCQLRASGDHIGVD